MNMFQINIKNVNINSVKDPDDIYISEAIETIYSNSGCIAELNWNGYFISILGSSIGSIYSNIVHMINQVELKKEYFVENFLDNGFTAKWQCYIEGDGIRIVAFFIDITYTKSTVKDMINRNNTINVKQELFIYEWKKLLNKINEDLISVGYNDLVSYPNIS